MQNYPSPCDWRNRTAVCIGYFKSVFVNGSAGAQNSAVDIIYRSSIKGSMLADRQVPIADCGLRHQDTHVDHGLDLEREFIEGVALK